MALLTTLRGSGDKFRDEFSLAFDGTNDYIATGLAGSILEGDFSISAWVKRTTSDTYNVIVGARDGANDIVQLYVTKSSASASNAISLVLADGSSTSWSTCADDTLITSDGWTHIVATQEDGSQKIYKNGVQLTLDSGGSYTVSRDITQTVHIGNNGVDKPWLGSISEVAIYNTVLTASQVKTIYNGREPYNHREGIASGNLQGWWRMGDGKFDIQKHERGASYISNSDVKNYVVSNEAATPTLSNELYLESNALGKENNADSITGLTVIEGGSTITSGTDQVENGRTGYKAIHIVTSANGDRVVEDLSGICTVGKAYRLTCVAKHGSSDGSGDNVDIRLDSGPSLTNANPTVIETIHPSESGWAFYGLNFIYTANTRYFGVREIGDNHNQSFYVSELSVKEFNTGTGVMTNMSLDDFEGDTP